MYCKDKKPLSSILIDILDDKWRAFVEGFSRLILYLLNNGEQVDFNLGKLKYHALKLCFELGKGIGNLSANIVSNDLGQPSS
jgi:hypothetical protein